MSKVSVIISIVFSIFWIFPTHIFAVTWLSGYTYQKAFYVTGSTFGDVTDYPVKLTLYKGSGTDSGTTFYLDNHALSSFSDIRFTSSDGTTLLHYWIESSDSSTATVWVKLDSVPASPSQTIFYLYYGNSSATGVSSGADTFTFFDDFDTDGITPWTGSHVNLHTDEIATQAVSSTIRVSTPNSANLYTAANCNAYPFDGVGSLLTRTFDLPSSNYSVDFNVMKEITKFGYNTTAYERSIVKINGSNQFSELVSCTGIDCVVAPETWASKSFDLVDSPITSLSLEGYSDDCTKGNVWFDNVRIRNSVSPEPTVSQPNNPVSTGGSSSSNNNSSSSTTASNTDSPAPTCGDTRPSSIPDLFQIDATGSSAKLFFTPISNTSDFYISFSENADALKYGERVSLTREGIQNETIHFLKPNTTYYFMVRGQNGCMPGDWSTIMKIRTPYSLLSTVSFYQYGPLAH